MKHHLKDFAFCIEVSGAQIFSEELFSKGLVGEGEEIFVKKISAPYQTIQISRPTTQRSKLNSSTPL